VIIDKESPFYAKATIFLIGFIALFTILYIGQLIILPLVFATIIAIVLLPVVNIFVRMKINRVIAIMMTIILGYIVIAALVALLYSQAVMFSESWPTLVNKFTALLNQIITWASGYFDINQQQIHEWITKTKGELVNAISSSIGHTLTTIGSGLVAMFLIPVYIFMILFYKPLILDVIHKLFSKDHQGNLSEIITQIKTVIQHYLVGLVIEFIIIAVLYSATLLILGIDYAILIGIIAAMLNVIPYIGGFVGIALPMMVALVTKSTAWYSFYILVIFYIIQFFDNHFIIPKIVASKVKINALFAILIVLVGNKLWGIPGMFLSIPLLAIVKLMFDHIESLKPWGLLLGDTMPPLLKIKSLRLGMKKIKTILKKPK
jgi:predicted PurR-regulated permease PerM